MDWRDILPQAPSPREPSNDADPAPVERAPAASESAIDRLIEQQKQDAEIDRAWERERRRWAAIERADRKRRENAEPWEVF